MHKSKRVRNYLKGIDLQMPAFFLGVIMLGYQVILLRNILDIFWGNELVFGVTLALWMTGTFLGSIFIAPLLKRELHYSIVLTGLYPFLLFNFLLTKMTPLIFHLTPGVTPPLSTIISIPAILILPVSLVLGILFPLMAADLSRRDIISTGNEVNRTYILESAGSFFCGILLTLLFRHSLNNLQLFAILSFPIFFLLPGRWDLFKSKFRKRIGVPVLLLAFAGNLLLFIQGNGIYRGLDQRTAAPAEVIKSGNTPYGTLKLLRHEDQLVVLNQGEIYYVDPSPETAESQIILPFLSHPNPQAVLFLGGNLNGYLPLLQQIKPLKQVDLVETDNSILQIQKSWIESSGFKSHFKTGFIVADPRSYFITTKTRYDLIFLNQPEPVTLSGNRLYSKSYYSLIKSRLKPGGIFCFSITSSENYIDRSLAQYIVLLENTLRSEFSHILVTPGDRSLFMASDTDYFHQIPQSWIAVFSRRQYKTQYFTTAFMQYTFSKERMRSFFNELGAARHTLINTDTNLNAYTQHFFVWGRLSSTFLIRIFQFLKGNLFLFLTIILTVTGLSGLYYHRKKRAQMLWQLFWIGFISISMEILIIFEYQVLFGTLYSEMAMLFALFMLGLALGAWFEQNHLSLSKNRAGRPLLIPGLLASCLIFLIPAALQSEILLHPQFYAALNWLLPGSLFSIAFFSGAYFTWTSRAILSKEGQKRLGLTYGIDLAGAVAGSFLSSLFFIPLLGLSGSFFTIICLILLVFYISPLLIRKGS